MKKFTMSLLLLGAGANAYAEESVIFEDNFDYLIPYTAVDPSGSNSVYDGMGINDCAPGCMNLKDIVLDGKIAGEEMESKGYELIYAPVKSTQSGPMCVYLQKTVENEETIGAYLRLGKGSYTAGLNLPVFSDLGEEGAKDVKVSFEWCPIRQGGGSYDKTHLIVLINDEQDTKVEVPAHTLAKNAPLAWIPVTVSMGAFSVKNGDRITIRNADDEWEDTSKKYYRYFFRNIKVTAENATSGVEVIADESAPVEYYNMQGIRVAEPSKGIY
ncbi:MAG: hypothetical protein K2K97_01820, partial [Muribaculaceae bacterium]|nr:hypothetical protein [Muribaculaceae bacterium]